MPTETIDTLKTDYNAALATARLAAEKAASLRARIVEIDPSKSGPSGKEHLPAAIRSLYMARTFDGLPGDLPVTANPYRNS